MLEIFWLSIDTLRPSELGYLHNNKKEVSMKLKEIYQAMSEGCSVVAKINGESRQCVITYIWTSEAFKGNFGLEDCVTKQEIPNPVHYKSIKHVSLYAISAKYYFDKEKHKIT